MVCVCVRRGVCGLVGQTLIGWNRTRSNNRAKKTKKRSKITRDCTRRCSGTLVVSTFSSVRAPLHCPLLTENSYNMQTGLQA